MNKVLASKVKLCIQLIRNEWSRLDAYYPFIAFSTGKDSLAMAAIMYEALETECPPCLYSHHDLEYPSNLEYLEILRNKNFNITVLSPFLEYFELMERGIAFLTLVESWCIPLLIGTAFVEWLKKKDAPNSRQGVMFRGISGSEYSHRWHSQLELNKTLNLPCFNPMLEFTKDEIIELIKKRYNLPMNPIYKHMDRTYCICCYTSDKKRQAYNQQHFPDVCNKYYNQIEKMLYTSGLIENVHKDNKFGSKIEKLYRHGFAHWHRIKAQNVIGAVKFRLSNGGLIYRIRNTHLIEVKHLAPLDGKWLPNGDEIRFWDVPERIADTVIKRMINCLECGFCMIECFQCRSFNRNSKTLSIEGCIQCGRCLSLKHCMGWRHRFWRRVILEGEKYGCKIN